jgi:hypothetical protein
VLRTRICRRWFAVPGIAFGNGTKKAPEGAFLQLGRTLDGHDVLCLKTFLALSYIELNALAFNQGFETGALYVAEVCEHVRAIFLLDKTKAFGFIEPLDGTSCFL